MVAHRIPNEYTVENGIGYIHVRNRKGEEYEFMVDIDILDKLIKDNINLCMQIGGGRTYAKFRRNNKNIPLHRFVMGAKEDQIVDHIDNNPLNNMRDNLRFVTSRENSRNLNNKSTGEIPIRGLSYAYTKGRKTSHVRMRISGYETKRFKTLELAKEHMVNLGIPIGEVN